MSCDVMLCVVFCCIVFTDSRYGLSDQGEEMEEMEVKPTPHRDRTGQDRLRMHVMSRQ